MVVILDTVFYYGGIKGIITGNGDFLSQIQKLTRNYWN